MVKEGMNMMASCWALSERLHAPITPRGGADGQLTAAGTNTPVPVRDTLKVSSIFFCRDFIYASS